jgi:hypothetical protein
MFATAVSVAATWSPSTQPPTATHTINGSAVFLIGAD